MKTQTTNQESTPPSDSASQPDPMEALKAELKEKENRYLYLAADFENFKKRQFAERQALLKYASESLGREILPVLDNLERAAEHRDPENHQSLLQGIDMVIKQFHHALSGCGIEKIDTRNQDFNPEWHDAVGKEASKEVPAGKIIREEQRGYRIFDRLLRPAKVVVSLDETQADTNINKE